MKHSTAPRRRGWIGPVVSIAGLCVAAAVVLAGARPSTGARPLDPPASSSFASAVAGAGLVEPSSEFIVIGSEVAGVVVEVPVVAGDDVRGGDVLLRLDDRTAAAELAARDADVVLAAAELARLEALPRPEELPGAEARAEAAEAALREAKSLLSLVEGIDESSATSRDEVERRRYQVEARKAALDEAQAAVELLRAGAWEPERVVARAALDAAIRRRDAAQTELERRTVRAPRDGRILRVDIRAGEFLAAGDAADSAIVMGATDVLHVRVDVDENEAWRVRPEAGAVASLRGNSAARIGLSFVRIEPYVVPKRSLTGASTERVDTRVLQIVYRIDAAPVGVPIYPGQQVDVFIEAPPRAAPDRAAQSPQSSSAP
jgi:multidrug efflux pump subunit AcrA (membrane-fusion protein)